MKYSIALLLQVFFFWATGCFARTPVAKITLHVVNQNNIPVTDVEVSASFWGGRQNIIKKPNKDGYISYSSPVLGDAVFGNIIHKTVHNPAAIDKYYATYLRRDYLSPSRNAKEGRWEPWNPIVEMPLKEYINPIPMYATGMRNRVELPILNQWIAFDLEKNDWVAPWGAGRFCDLEVRGAWNGIKRESFEGYQIEFRIRQPHAGMYLFERDKTSGLQSPYRADIYADYRHHVAFYKKKDEASNRVVSAEFDSTKGLIFRTRTKVDNNGRLKSARYGKLYGVDGRLLQPIPGKPRMSITLSYYFNPTENDTNLEFDPERNLLKNVRGYVDP